MTEQLDLTRAAPGVAEEDNAKRHQIVEGARKVFLNKGFDAASMNDIAKAAGVSKGTLYVYFENKEKLFQVICSQECEAHSEDLLNFTGADPDVGATLTRVGIAFVRHLCRPDKASSARTVIAIAERMPEVGRSYYESGPAKGIARLTAYFRAQIAAGTLEIEDPELAAAQFIESCHATLFKPMIFNFGAPPTEDRIAHCVGVAVKTFLAAYKRR